MSHGTATTRRKLPPYRPRAKCPKCGHQKVDTTFHAAKMFYQDGCVFAGWHGGKMQREHLHRTCLHCGFEWPEACEDSKWKKTKNPTTK
jgi:transcription elongation factor Elf1